MAIAFAAGVHWGPTGLATAWVLAYPAYLGISAWRSLPVIGARVRDLAEAVAPPLLAAIAMALAVALIDRALPPLAPPPRLAILTGAGAVTYGLWLLLFARQTVRDLLRLVRMRRATA